METDTRNRARHALRAAGIGFVQGAAGSLALVLVLLGITRGVLALVTYSPQERRTVTPSLESTAGEGARFGHIATVHSRAESLDIAYMTLRRDGSLRTHIVLCPAGYEPDGREADAVTYARAGGRFPVTVLFPEGRTPWERTALPLEGIVRRGCRAMRD